MEIIKLERKNVTTSEGDVLDVQFFNVNGVVLGVEDPDCTEFKYHDIVDSDGWPANVSPESKNLQLHFAGEPLFY